MDHTCHDMNPPHPYSCRACEVEREAMIHTPADPPAPREENEQKEPMGNHHVAQSGALVSGLTTASHSLPASIPAELIAKWHALSLHMLDIIEKEREAGILSGCNEFAFMKASRIYRECAEDAQAASIDDATSLVPRMFEIVRTLVLVCDSGDTNAAQLLCTETSPLIGEARAILAAVKGDRR